MDKAHKHVTLLFVWVLACMVVNWLFHVGRLCFASEWWSKRVPPSLNPLLTSTDFSQFDRKGNNNHRYYLICDLLSQTVITRVVRHYKTMVFTTDRDVQADERCLTLTDQHVWMGGVLAPWFSIYVGFTDSCHLQVSIRLWLIPKVQTDSAVTRLDQ